MAALSFSKRYLFGKKSTNAINIISGVSVLGISIGTAALILVMSVLNGFEGLIKGLMNSFNPDLKITLVEGKTFPMDDTLLAKLGTVPDVLSVSAILEETALLEYKGIKDFAILKGVDSNFIHQSALPAQLSEGNFVLKSPLGYHAVTGIGIRNKLAISIDDDFARLSAFMPDPKGSTFQPFKKRILIPSGVFSIQQEYDNKYVFVDLGFIQDLVGKTNQVSGIEIALQDYTKRNLVSAAIQKVLGQEYKIQDRDQQDAAFYKLMQIEKWVSYAILSFVLVLVAFNIVGALWMIVLEKKKDLMVLKSMGMKDHRVKLIVLSTGLLITGLGICIGFALAVILFLLQQKYGLVPIPEGFLVDRYPIEIKWFDFLVVGLTVTGIGIVASILPARKAAVLHEAIRYE
ncbi:MAG: FtsX-like permease family protein [Saprospiraceae bacterium]|jgi:lipoprotein-releasing system permease protein|nr:FtsX-like permease family protein [Saprospiraceae bacterium]MBK6479973.1 FtsX-like permease family protein [Saprospiraceae bacterium]MBK6815168.1 FtsX-like permease family protein [Saprospiraceae bacterium]MBK7372206.1 FtsX-like permease family protein [Saprospiraceae bacterium]MBK7607693.1 FtsX-like permease family protein [Saprospiraceae bacterium]